MSRLEDMQRFYDILDKLEQKIEGARSLADPDWKIGLPERGVYFFFEPGEIRTNMSGDLRVVRVGIGPRDDNAKSATLAGRLSNHKGNEGDEGGNHRGLVFRAHVGRSLIDRDGLKNPKWKCTSKDLRPLSPSERKAIKEDEGSLEHEVSAIIRQMPFLWVAVYDEDLRRYLEKNSIALLSNMGKGKEVLNSHSCTWLGKYHPKSEVRNSGLWNIEHTDKEHEDGFLEILESTVNEM